MVEWWVLGAWPVSNFAPVTGTGAPPLAKPSCLQFGQTPSWEHAQLPGLALSLQSPHCPLTVALGSSSYFLFVTVPQSSARAWQSGCSGAQESGEQSSWAGSKWGPGSC